MKLPFNTKQLEKAKRWISNISIKDVLPFGKAIFGDPVEPRASKVTVNAGVAEYTLSTANYDKWVNEAFKRNEVINGSLNLITNTFIESKLKYVDVDGEQVLNSPLEQLMDHINEHDTTGRFFRQLLLDMYLGDVGYIEKVFDARGRVTELGLLRPDRVQIHTDPELFIIGYTYQVNGSTFELSTDRVLPIQFIDPSDRFVGFSPLKSLAKRIDSDNTSTDHSVTMLQNRGQPGSIITIPGDAPFDPSNAEALARSWDQRFTGKRNGQTGVLYGGMTYQPFGMSMKDLDFTALKEVDEAKILSTLRIPLQVYGSITGDAASTFNNMKQARKQFWEQAIIPLQRIIEDIINNDKDLTLDGTVFLKFDNSDVQALQEDMSEVAARCKDLYQGGIITLNEARFKLGFDEIDNGDELYSPINQFGLPAATQEELSIDYDHLVCKNLPYDAINNDSRDFESKGGTIIEVQPELNYIGALNSLKAEVKEEVEEVETKPLVEGPDACSPEGMSANIGTLISEGKTQSEAIAISLSMCERSKELEAIAEDEDRQRGIITRLAAMEPEEAILKLIEFKDDLDDDIINQLAIGLQRESLAKKFLRDYQKLAKKHLQRQLDDSIALVGSKSEKQVKQFESTRLENGLQLLQDEWTLELQTDSLQLMSVIVEESASQSAASVGGSFNIESESVQRQLQSEAFKFADTVSSTSSKQVRDIFTTAFQEGQSLGVIRDNLQALEPSWTVVRADLIARTETARAANGGAVIGYRESGVVERMQYSAILDGSTSEICQALNGRIVDINGSFIEHGQGFVGESGKATNLSYTGGGIDFPPAHPQCRSTVIPIISK